MNIAFWLLLFFAVMVALPPMAVPGLPPKYAWPMLSVAAVLAAAAVIVGACIG